jgi:hypothetical protein
MRSASGGFSLLPACATPAEVATVSKSSAIAFVNRHRKGLIAAGVVLASAAGAGYRAISEARAEKVPEMIQVPAPDVSALRQDIGDLRGDIRDERKAREELTRQMTDFNGRLGRLEGAAAAAASTTVTAKK